MKFSKKILETFVKLPKDESRRNGSEGGWQDLMADVGLEIKSVDGDIFNLELLANRGDHYCYSGIAREISGRTGAKVAEFPSIPLEQKPAKLFQIDTDKCIAYSLTPFRITPHALRLTPYEYMLTASGVNVIRPAIDMTNVVMLELGQPGHVYDADKIKGKIHIRESKKGEKAALLFHEVLTELPAGTCVIADEEKILCVGGVIGCRAAEVDESTKNVLFETALFDPVSIRKTSRALGVSSIASQIFERGGNIAALCDGAARAAYLYSKIGWEQSGKFEFARTKYLDKKYIKMSGDYVRKQLEINISDKEIKERLARYGFSALSSQFSVPTWRYFNIKGEAAELIETLTISIGYNSLPSKLPPMEIGAAPTAAELRKAEIDSYLVHNGFYEVFTDNLYSPKHAAMSPLKEHIGLENSVDGAYSFLRNNTIVQAAELVAKNLNVKNREIRVFEWGKIFKKTGEFPILWGVMNGGQVSALTAKGLLENLFRDLGLDASLEYGEFAESHKVSEWELLHPKRRARISCDGRGICVFGEIHPKLLAEFDIKNDAPVFFSFDTTGLMNAVPKKIKYESPMAIIPSQRDISIAVSYGRGAGDVAEKILKKYPQVARAEITDVYDKPKENLRNITFTLTFKGNHSTEELNKLILEIINELRTES